MELCRLLNPKSWSAFARMGCGYVICDQCLWEKGGGSLPGNADSIPPNAAHRDVGFLSARTCCCTVVTWWPPGLSRPLLPCCFPAGGWPAWRDGIVPPQVQDSALLLELQGARQSIFSILLRTLWMPTQPSGISNTTSSFVPSPNLLRVHPAPTFGSLMKKLNLLCWANTTNDWPIRVICTTDYNALSPTIQPILNPICFTFI